MLKTKLLAKIKHVREQEILSVWLIILACALNFGAWVIPRGSYRNPTHDPLHAARLVSSLIENADGLYYFWHAMITITFAIIAFAAYRVWTLSMTRIVDRVDS